MTRFWLAFTTPPMKERAAEEDLRMSGILARVPLVERVRVVRGKRSIIRLPALRGYVFAEFPFESDHRMYCILGSRFVHRVVGFNRKPGKIAESVMADFVSKLEEPVSTKPQFQLQNGAKVSIKKGAFAELNGIVLDVDGDSAKVLVELFGRSCETKVALIQLEEIDAGSLKTSSREKRRLQGARKSGFVNAG